MATSEWDGNLTLANIMTPHGFASLAAAVAAQLREHGKVFMYLDEDNNILHKDPGREVAICNVPALVVQPEYIVDTDDDKGLLTVRLEGVQVLNHSGLVLGDDPEPDDDDL